MTPPRRALSPSLTHLSLFLLGSLGWVLLLSTIAGMVARAAGATSMALDEVIELLGPGFLGYTSILQILGIGALSIGMARLLPPLEPPQPDPLSDTLGLRRASGRWLLAAGIGGLTIWTFPSWCATQLVEASSEPSTVELITDALITGPLAQTWPLVLAIVVSAPIVEEIIFRGYLWSVLERTGVPGVAFLGTSLLFALYHLDPIHVLTLMPTALFFGLLRWGSGSLWPCALAHFANNGVGVLAALLSTDQEGTFGLLPAVFGLVVACAVVAAAWATHRSEP